MKITVCIRQGLDGEINPFDACAYEEALRIEGAEITLLSMGAPSAKDFLHALTRLGAKKAILLSDRSFAGADTLATAYTLSLALRILSPDLVFCGRQTLVGDTAQTGAMLSVFAACRLITNVMHIDALDESQIVCTTRQEGVCKVTLPALLTIERINTLRLPRLRSKMGDIEVWDAQRIGADVAKCGLAGSPTRVLQTFENESGKRKCRLIARDELESAIREGLSKNADKTAQTVRGGEKLPLVLTIGEDVRSFASGLGERTVELPLDEAMLIAEKIKELAPSAVIWGSDSRAKRISAQVAAMLSLGLCADCTALDCEEGTLMMYRPALAGSIVAKIKSLTVPSMATVRTESENAKNIIVAAGYGVRDCMDRVRAFADSLGAELCATRKAVDNDFAPYTAQVGLTGKCVSPPVYIALGVSGAVHHIVGMQRAGTVIAVNPDRDAPIFDYADFGIVDEF